MNVGDIETFSHLPNSSFLTVIHINDNNLNCQGKRQEISCIAH